MKENDINQLCNVYDLCKSELIAGCVQASEKDVQEWWKSCQQLLHSEKSDFRTKEKVILMFTKLLAEKSELLEKTEKLETEVAELRARLEKVLESPVKIGDKKYMPDCRGIMVLEETVVGVRLSWDETCGVYVNFVEARTQEGVVERFAYDYWQVLYNTYEAAEARLKELKEEEE